MRFNTYPVFRGKLNWCLKLANFGGGGKLKQNKDMPNKFSNEYLFDDLLQNIACL